MNDHPYVLVDSQEGLERAASALASFQGLRRRLENAGRERDLVGGGPKIGVHRRRAHLPLGAVDRLVRNPELLRRGPDRMMHLIMDASVDAYFPLLDQIDEFVDGLEARVFEHSGLVNDVLLHLDRYSAMFGIYGLAEAVHAHGLI